jgi:hypothetical protein
MDSKKTWLEKTGQKWRLKSSVLLGLVTLFFSVRQLLAKPGRDTYEKGNWFLIVGTLWLLWTFLAVRCRACSRSVSWWAIKNVAFAKWMSAIWNLERCPMCGDTGER